jgi:DNA-binding beta-propeller fold protein YncE
VSGAVLGLLGSAAATPAAGAASNTGGSFPGLNAAAAESAPASGLVEGRETVYVFNVGSKDITLIDAANRRVRETRPLGASVRWLSNEQTYWDGGRIWTYDFPSNQLQAIAIDPKQLAITKTISGVGKGPGHSLVVLPDKKKAAINVAGDNVIAFLDLEAGQVESTLKTGAFP